MSCGALGAAGRLYIDAGAAPNTWDVTSETWEFLRESVRKSETILHTGGITGTRSQPANRSRRGPFTVGGEIVFNPSPNLLDKWLPRILGAAEVATDTFGVAETLPEFAVMIERTTSRNVYTDCKVASATLRGQAGGWVELAVNVLGKGATTAAAPAVNLGTGAADMPYVFTDCVLEIDGEETVPIGSFQLTIDNAIQTIANNSVSPTCLRETDRIVTLNFNAPYNSDLYTKLGGNGLNNGVGYSALVSMTNGVRSCSIALAAIQFEEQDATITNKQEVRWDFTATCRATATKEIIVTNDAT